MNGKEILSQLNNPVADRLFLSLYGPEMLESNRKRYEKLVKELINPAVFSAVGVNNKDEIRLYTAAGRTELGGNHTDHNHGKILAASINLDIAAVAVKRPDKRILFRSTDFSDVIVNLDDLRPRPEERGTTEALIRGIVSVFDERGDPVGGLIVNADSAVLPGSGLSSSAAIESLFGKIIDDMYGQGNCTSLEIAKIGQYAENIYFGKPCGLMDQIACATGGAVMVDFGDIKDPLVDGIVFDLTDTEFVLCIVNAGGSHANLTPDYALIPNETKSVAAFFGKEVLREVEYAELIDCGNEIRESCGDRAMLRAIHYFNENRRVDVMADTLRKIVAALNPDEKKRYTRQFLELVNESGHSSWELLQNVYTEKKISADSD
jgi:galactokinase